MTLSVIEHRFKLASSVLAVISLIIGVIVVIGWVLDIELLKSVLPNIVSMKANTALCFIMLSLSGIFLHPEIGVMRAISTDLGAGILVRCSMILLIVVLVISDMLVFSGVHFKVYDEVFANGLHSVVLLIMFGIMITISSFALMRDEKHRQRYALKYEELYNLSTGERCNKETT